ncbi:hypothetical protein GCM10009551_022410 [Nocardiopsis tropica]
MAEGVADEFAQNEGGVVDAVLTEFHRVQVPAQPLPGSRHARGVVGEYDAPLDLLRAVPGITWGAVT